MELVFSIAIGVLAGSGVWLVLRPRTFQVLMGLTLLSYATNLFIFGMGRLQTGRAPLIVGEGAADAALYADPVPQALVLTAIVIGFGTTALLLVLLLALRALTGTDHVDGRDAGMDARGRATQGAADGGRP
jgi:multicomponent K+:H+ antiporter subunit C